jgi:hypothetical protein
MASAFEHEDLKEALKRVVSKKAKIMTPRNSLALSRRI